MELRVISRAHVPEGEEPLLKAGLEEEQGVWLQNGSPHREMKPQRKRRPQCAHSPPPPCPISTAPLGPALWTEQRDGHITCDDAGEPDVTVLGHSLGLERGLKQWLGLLC